MFKFLLVVYNVCFPLLFLLYFPFYLHHLIRRGGFWDGFGERFGLFRTSKRRQLVQLERPIWIHAVSVGETVAALSFIQRWTETRPDLQVVLSTTTSTGQAIARERSPGNVTVIYSPIDFYPWVALSLRAIKPAMMVIFEVEIWPNIIVASKRRGIPLALVNGRLSDKSAVGYAQHPQIFRPIFQRFDLLAVQTKEDADRLEWVIGPAEQIHVCNTMKFDQVPDQQAAAAGDLLEQVFPAEDRLVFMAASTHPGEEAVMADSYRDLRQHHPQLRLVLVPRHVERSAEIAQLLEERQLSCQRLTQLRQSSASGAPADVLLVDTTGEMMAFLAAADIVYMGKTLAGNEGGHNIIEPAIFGKPIIHGEKMGNFRLVAQIFRDRQAAVEVEDEAGFHQALQRLIEDPAERQRLSTASRQTVEAQRGAIARTIGLLEKLLP